LLSKGSTGRDQHPDINTCPTDARDRRSWGWSIRRRTDFRAVYSISVVYLGLRDSARASAGLAVFVQTATAAAAESLLSIWMKQ